MVYTFVCTIACFINDDWEITERVINFKPLEDKEHEGLYGGKAFANGAYTPVMEKRLPARPSMAVNR